MIQGISPARCPGAIRSQAGCGDLIGMGMARPRCAAESARDRPPVSSPCSERGRCERVKQRQTPCPHWTRATRPAAAHMSPSDHVTRCRQVSLRRAKRRPWTDSLTPVPRIKSAADLMVWNGSAPARSVSTSSRRRAKCAQANPSQSVSNRDQQTMNKRQQDKAKKAARKLPKHMQDVAFSKRGARAEKQRKARLLGTFGAASEVRRIDPSEYKINEGN